MTTSDIVNVRDWYERSYRAGGFQAQRQYPNEELLRFFGRNYFHVPSAKRRAVRVLEVGCGSGANLWMIAKEGFRAFGIELSPNAVGLCRTMLEKWAVKADIRAGDMTSLPYTNSSFDVVVDVVSSCCMNKKDFEFFLGEVHRVLKPGGRFFTYTHSKRSDIFKKPGPAKRLDTDTLDGVRRKGAPYYGNFYPIRFTTPSELSRLFRRHKLAVTYSETVSRTYRSGKESVEFVVMEGTKSPREL